MTHLNHKPVSSSLIVKLFLSPPSIADDVRVHEVHGGDVGGDVEPGVQLVGGLHAHVHHVGVDQLRGNHGLGTGDETRIIVDQDDGVVIGMSVPVSEELVGAGGQLDPSSSLGFSASSRLLPETSKCCLEGRPRLSSQ